MNNSSPNFHLACRHLSRRDRILKRIITEIGPCKLPRYRDGFQVLTRSIVSQQLSTKAALTIHGRMVKALNGSRLTPASLLALPDEALQAAGLSRAKRASLRDLAEKVLSGHVVFSRTARKTDEELIEMLVLVRGIGRWTAEMFLIFSLNRLDILPVADLGLRTAFKRHYGFKEMPATKEMEEIAETWRPYRSVATWYLWKSLGGLTPTKKD